MKPQVPLSDLLDALTPAVRPEMVKRFVPNCCTATCRILRHIFFYFGYEAEPMPVLVKVFNPTMRKMIEDGTAIPDEPEERLTFLNDRGAWAVGLVPYEENEDRGNFGGHVVLHVGKLIVDASLQQAQRHKRNIVLPPLMVFSPSPAFLEGREEMTGTVNDCFVIYQRIDDHSFEESPDWQSERDVYAEVMRSIFLQTEARLKAQKENIRHV